MKVYCKDCKFENDKLTTTGLEVSSEKWGFRSHQVKGCGQERIKFSEDENGCSFIPQRNITNDCRYYQRKWYKFWVRDKK